MTLSARPDGDFTQQVDIGFLTQQRMSQYLGVELFNGVRVHPEALLTAIDHAEGNPIPPVPRPLGKTKVYTGDMSGDTFLGQLSKLRAVADEAAKHEVDVLFV